MSLNKTIPEGQWVVKYDPAEFDYPFVLETLVDIQSHSPSHDNDLQINHVVFHKNKDTNYSYNKGIPQGAAVIPEVTVIKILLANPVRLNDKRWDTIHLTSASLFLGSTLGHSGFDVSTRKIVIPYTKSEPGFNDYHMVGFTLFEDLFLETRELMEGLIENNYKGLLAAGGPMITLNPMESAWHYPHLNLLVRGEAELLLPHLLDALNRKDLQSLLQEKGFLFHVPGTIIISHLETINRPADFSGFRFALPSREGFPGVDGYKRFLENGLELNLSRGCRRGCIFCSRVQGATLRKLPVERFKQLLGDFAGEVKALGVTSPHALSININDDDILQDPDYAAEVFEAVVAANFKLWGIQTSLNSFFHRRDGTFELNRRVLELIDNKVLYMESKPLVWLGTDTFLKKRGKKLGKVLPSEEQILELMEEFEVRGIRNYHYWISSDHGSDWSEFFREFLFIHKLRTDFETFGLIAHAPFLVPYPSTPLYRLLVKTPELESRILYKSVKNMERVGRKEFELPLVERVETAFEYLNRLLDNERLEGRPGFFESLKERDYLEAFITLYNFLKHERLLLESRNFLESEKLRVTEQEVEEFISTII